MKKISLNIFIACTIIHLFATILCYFLAYSNAEFRYREENNINKVKVDGIFFDSYEWQPISSNELGYLHNQVILLTILFFIGAPFFGRGLVFTLEFLVYTLSRMSKNVLTENHFLLLNPSTSIKLFLSVFFPATFFLILIYLCLNILMIIYLSILSTLE